MASKDRSEVPKKINEFLEHLKQMEGLDSFLAVTKNKEKNGVIICGGFEDIPVLLLGISQSLEKEFGKTITYALFESIAKHYEDEIFDKK